MFIENFISNIFMDKSCLCCNRNIFYEKEYLCSSCSEILEKSFYSNLCIICKHPLFNSTCPSCVKLGEIYFDSLNFIQYYNDISKRLVYNLKISGNFLINKLFFYLIKKKKLLNKENYITVVPDDIFSFYKKGRAGLSYLLKLLKNDGYKVIKSIYKKRIYFKNQKNKNVLQRLTDIKNIFFLPEKNINRFEGEIFLIDDVYTTGATVNYGAYLLKKAGFKKVHVITMFRSIIS